MGQSEHVPEVGAPAPTVGTERPSSASGGGGGGPEGSKGRRVAFRIVAILTSLWVLALMVFGLTEVVLMWLPADTLGSVGDSLDLGELDLAHRAHYMSIGVVAWALLLGVVVQLRRPARREASMLHVLAVAVGSAVVYGLSGGLGAWLFDLLILVVPLLLLGFLHPRARELARIPAMDRGMVTLAAVAAAPWLVFAFVQAQQQWRNVAGDTHAEMDHWASVALMALLIVACAFIGSTDHTGWRLTAWIAALATFNYGLHSLVYPQPASAASTPWAIAAVVWGVLFAAAIVRRGRTEPARTDE